MLSGQRVDLATFKSGWLLAPSASTAHHYSRVGAFKAKCGRPFGDPWRDPRGIVAFEPGGFPRCKACQRRA